jgi:syntaxin 16
MKELHSLHDKHLNRPTMEDNFEGEKLIDHLTQEITQVLGQCQMRVKKFSNKSNMGKINSSTDKRLLKNVVNNLATALQDLTSDFRKNQNLYLKSNVIKFNNSSHIEPFLSQKIISSIKL